ncbi:MAG: type II secretion system protein [bacterium]|nr:type II secretion system protein [bacterium]
MEKFTAKNNRGMARSIFSRCHPEYSRGMTYVELVVVLGIMGVLSSVVMFNHGKFQGKIDIKNLANDIALKVVEAQKSSMSGKWNSATTLPNWKPSYGLYFNIAGNSNADKFIYFSDLDNDDICDPPACTPSYTLTNEVLDIVNITKGNTVSSIEVFGTGSCPATVTNLTILFKRPNSSPAITSTPPLGCSVSYIAINVTSPKGVNSKIKMYSSGRVQIN